MKHIRSCIAAGLWVLGGIGILHADSVADKFGVSGYAGAAFPGGDKSVVDHTGNVGHDFGGMLRVGLTPHWSMGASYDNINLYGKDGERHHPETLLGDVFYHLSPDRKLVPTFQLGVGAGSTLTDGAITKFSVRTGLGVDYFFCPYLSAGPQLNYTFIEHGSGAVDEYHVFGAGLLVNLYFDKPRNETPPPVAVVPEVTPMPVEQTVTIELKVLFDTGKSVIKPDFRPEIQKVANFMDDHQKSTGEIDGHSDDTGSADMNKRLSEERANAVRDYLIKEFHIAPSRLTAVGYGESGPTADNATPEGRQQNRRVVAIFHGVKLVPKQ